MNINNFSAGPSKIPRSVIKDISRDIINYDNLDYSILELSHRSDKFSNIINKTKAYLTEFLDIPSNFEIIFLQGGATFQNTFIPANNPQIDKDIIFLLSGTWGTKTFKDFNNYFNSRAPSISLQNQSFDEIISEINNFEESYLYLTSNETIEGYQIKEFDKIKNKKLIIDMSSDICSYKFNWKNIAYVYAGAQKNLGIPGVTICIFDKEFSKVKNLPSYLKAENHIEKNSAFNTPPTFSIYVMLKLLEWIHETGGIDNIEKNSIKKAKYLYDFLDDNNEKLILNVPKEYRSHSNIVFDFKNKNQTPLFLEESISKGFIGLNGHRSVGGIRVSNYNSIDMKMIEEFIKHLKSFLSNN
jgi:phosphoserine aminotransferase